MWCAIMYVNLFTMGLVFGRPFVKRFALCYRTVVLSVCLSVLSVCLSICDVGVLWPNGWIKVKLGMEVGLGPGHIVLDGDPARPKKVRARQPHTFSVHIYYGQTVAHLS